ncbi:hypothetical protein ER57_15420 [Smithella sp. SCADC]|jgi:hypothetical protein|nr:hypothetical protein ER57_15420 [Smithella sp. SCADC]
MRIAIVILLVFCMSSFSFAEETMKVKQATIRGETIKVGQGADIVQSRIEADKYVTSYIYGDTSKEEKGDRFIFGEKGDRFIFFRACFLAPGMASADSCPITLRVAMTCAVAKYDPKSGRSPRIRT